MKRKLIALVLTGLFCFSALALAAGPPDVVTLTPKKGTVTLKHKAHSDRLGGKCDTCHHTSKPDGSDAKKCKECHKKDKSKMDGKDVPKLKKALHGKCQGCHKETKKAGKPSGPTKKCKECHKK